MRIVDSSFEIVQAPANAEQLIEQFGRVCYKSENRITAKSAVPFCKRLIDSQHESVLEHASMSVRFVVDRGVSHELVRHRLASFSQESTRYVNYGKRGLEFVKPSSIDEIEPAFLVWRDAMAEAERAYNCLLAFGRKPEEARTVLPNSTKTELVMTANFREWRHVLRLRTSERAHPDMRAVMVPLLAECQRRWEGLFAYI